MCARVLLRIFSEKKYLENILITFVVVCNTQRRMWELGETLKLHKVNGKMENGTRVILKDFAKMKIFQNVAAFKFTFYIHWNYFSGICAIILHGFERHYMAFTCVPTTQSLAKIRFRKKRILNTLKVGICEIIFNVFKIRFEGPFQGSKSIFKI